VRANDGRKLDHRTLEVLRLRAVEQVQAGAHPEDVAAALGLHRKTVYGWLAKFREGGRDALVAKPVPGRPPKLSGAQIARLYQLIVGSDPAQFSFEFALWTRDMVRQVIRREFKISLETRLPTQLIELSTVAPGEELRAAQPEEALSEPVEGPARHVEVDLLERHIAKILHDLGLY
jgi:transposase